MLASPSPDVPKLLTAALQILQPMVGAVRCAFFEADETRVLTQHYIEITNPSHHKPSRRNSLADASKMLKGEMMSKVPKPEREEELTFVYGEGLVGMAAERRQLLISSGGQLWNSYELVKSPENLQSQNWTGVRGCCVAVPLMANTCKILGVCC